MTLKELSQLYYLKREIAMDERRLEELRTKAASPPSPRLDGMPQGAGGESRVERFAVEAADLSAIIAAKREQCIHKRRRLERYISDIDDSLTRQIFTLRFVDGLSWVQVARRVGGSNTEKNVSVICYRYIKRHSG